ncbi:MAG: hypothetical protein JXA09_08470, partial [Anaerolineae bacterium]|nr:hypothetical protein [Anaerolineae bacterium]
MTAGRQAQAAPGKRTATGTRIPWRDVAVVALLCLSSVAFYRQIALSNRILAGVDAFTYFYPYRAYAADALRSGRIPLWNPYLYLGVPYLANAQAAVLYPLNLLLAGLTAPKIVAWSVVLHVALAAASAYGYARCSLHLSPAPAALGAVAFAYGGYLSGQVEHVNQLNVAAWFPLLLLLWDRRAPVRQGAAPSGAAAARSLLTPPVLGIGAAAAR